MRQDDDERHTVLPWGNPSGTKARFAVGDVVRPEPYDTPGTVVAVGVDTVSIVWSDGAGGAIVYPIEATFLVKTEKLPWQ